MAAIKDALTQILAKLSALTDGTGAPVFRYVAVFNDQFEQLEQGKVESFPLPCCLVEPVRPVSWLPIGENLRQADITWRMHIGMEQLDAGDGTMEQNLDVFDQLRNPIISGMTGFRPIGCGSLFAIEDEPDYKHTNVYHDSVAFKCGMIDSKGSKYDPGSGKVGYTNPPTPLQINNSVSHDPVGDGIEEEFKGEYIIESEV